MIRRGATVVVMLKEPRVGRVKTRLARDIGAVPATWWFRHQTARLLRRIEDPRWRIVLALAPDTSVASPIWPEHLPRTAQGRGNLGARMGRMLDRFDHGPTLVIGADIPGIDRAAIAACFARIGPNDAVLGPAPDGGYWAIGLRHPRRRPRAMFDGVRWSSPHARADTERSLSGLSIGYGPTLRDVDTAEDLHALN